MVVGLLLLLPLPLLLLLLPMRPLVFTAAPPARGALAGVLAEWVVRLGAPPGEEDNGGRCGGGGGEGELLEELEEGEECRMSDRALVRLRWLLRRAEAAAAAAVAAGEEVAVALWWCGFSCGDGDTG